MSIQAMVWALKVDVRPAMAKLLLIAIANYADENGDAWPSKSTLARDCSTDKSTVCKHLRDLKVNGLIDIEERSVKGANLTSIITVKTGAITTSRSTPTSGQPPTTPSEPSPTTPSGSEPTTPGGCEPTGVVGETRQNPLAEPSVRTVKEVSAEVMRLLIEAAGPVLAAKAHHPSKFHLPAKWLSEGFDLHREILPAIRKVAARGKPIDSWAYFSSAIAEARTQRVPEPPPDDPETKRLLAEQVKRRKVWSAIRKWKQDNADAILSGEPYERKILRLIELSEEGDIAAVLSANPRAQKLEVSKSASAF